MNRVSGGVSLDFLRVTGGKFGNATQNSKLGVKLRVGISRPIIGDVLILTSQKGCWREWNFSFWIARNPGGSSNVKSPAELTFQCGLGIRVCMFLDRDHPVTDAL